MKRPVRWAAACVVAWGLCPAAASDLPLVVSVSPERLDAVRGGLLTVTGDAFEPGAVLSLLGGGPFLSASHLLPEGARGVESSGGMACLAFYSHSTKLGGIQLLDVTGAPREVGRFETGDSGIGVITRGGLAYVAFLNPYTFVGGVHVLDVSDPHDPRRVGTFDPLADPQAIALEWPLLFVADGVAGLVVVDVSDPSAPRLAGRWDSPGTARDVAVSGGFAYVADAEGGLRILDARDPGEPAEIGSMPPAGAGGTVTAVSVAEGVAWMADSMLGLVGLDVHDPSTPRAIGHVPLADPGWGVALRGSRAWVAAGSSGLQVVDLADPTRPRIVGSAGLPGNSGYFLDVALDGDRAYVADLINGLQVIDVAHPSAPGLAGSTDLEGPIAGVASDGTRIWAAAGEAGVVRLDLPLTAAASPGLVKLAGPARAAEAGGGRLFVAAGSAGLRELSLADPESPAEIGAWDTPGDALDVAVAGDLAMVADGSRGLQILDVSAPGAPALLATFDTPGSARGLAVHGDLVWVADDFSGVTAVDIGRPAEPRKAGSYDTPGRAVDAAVSPSGETLFVADLNRGVQVLDIRDPAHPVLRAVIGTEGAATGVTLLGDRLYVGDGFAGVQEYDVTRPESPVWTGSYETPGSAGRMTAQGDDLLVADGTGVRVIHPNPALPAPEWIDGQTLRVTVPPGLTGGVYDVRVANTDGESAILRDGLTVCSAIRADAALVREGNGWIVRLEEGGGGDASAVLDFVLPAEAPVRRLMRVPGHERIDLTIPPAGPPALLLQGPDPHEVERLWDEVVRRRGFVLPIQDDGTFGPLELTVVPPAGRGEEGAGARYHFELRDGVLVSARIGGRGAELFVETRVVDDAGCDGVARLSVREALTR